MVRMFILFLVAFVTPLAVAITANFVDGNPDMNLVSSGCVFVALMLAVVFFPAAFAKAIEAGCASIKRNW